MPTSPPNRRLLADGKGGGKRATVLLLATARPGPWQAEEPALPASPVAAARRRRHSKSRGVRYDPSGMAKGKPRATPEGDVEVVTEKRTRTDKPRLWRVILHNDDFTTMEFVIEVLASVFNKSAAEATDLMLQVHRRGACVAGVYTHEVAETKIARVEAMAREAEFPFLATMERDE